MILSLRVTGGDRIAANLRAISKNMPEIAERALIEEAEIDKIEAVKRTPIDTGDLRASARVVAERRDLQRRDLAASKVYITFGDDTEGREGVFYAVYVHEDPDAYHPVGEYKFLESTLKESAPFMSERVSRRIENELRKYHTV
jgi:hypothetical protein